MKVADNRPNNEGIVLDTTDTQDIVSIVQNRPCQRHSLCLPIPIIAEQIADICIVNENIGVAVSKPPYHKRDVCSARSMTTPGIKALVDSKTIWTCDCPLLSISKNGYKVTNYRHIITSNGLVMSWFTLFKM
ncbi:MAG: hypothetical protein AB1589_07960 [Cyanobacteriota bacterium]